MLRIEGITDDDFTRSISPALLKMVTIGNLIILVTSPTGFFRAVRQFTLKGERTSIESFKDNLIMVSILGGD